LYAIYGYTLTGLLLYSHARNSVLFQYCELASHCPSDQITSGL